MRLSQRNHKAIERVATETEADSRGLSLSIEDICTTLDPDYLKQATGEGRKKKTSASLLLENVLHAFGDSVLHPTSQRSIELTVLTLTFILVYFIDLIGTPQVFLG